MISDRRYDPQEQKMSKEKKEQKQEKPEVKVFKGRQRKQRKPGAKKIDVMKSADLFDEEFYIYWPDPSLDLEEYEDDDGEIDIDAIPEDCLLEFTCRYIDSGTFLEIAQTPLSYDIPEDSNLTPKQMEQIHNDAIQNQIENRKSEQDIQAEVILTCVIDPQFESAEQIQKILPRSLQIELYAEITKGAVGVNLVSRFQKSDR